MSTAYHTKFTLKFRDADPAQIMYFGNLFSIAHDAFEEFIVAAGYKYHEWFSKTEHMIPIRHAEADFLAPFVPGFTYDIEMGVAEMRETSFTMKYTFRSRDKVHGTVLMVHAVLDPQTKQKMKIPAIMRSRLEKYLVPGS